MKRKIILLGVVMFLVFCEGLNSGNVVFATGTQGEVQQKSQENQESQDAYESVDAGQVIEEQSKNIGIGDFLEEAKKYTDENFGDVDVGELFSNAITGSIKNETLFSKIIYLAGREVRDVIRVLGSILVIIVIHSIIRSISEGFENKSVSQITYYVQYILIVSVVMSNFSEIINDVKNTIQNLVGFTECLLPLLTTLMIATGSITTSSMLEPIILLLINFIGNIIQGFILPLLLVSTALGIISRISDKIQISKISDFFKSTIVWILGIVLTLFVGVTSLEGTLTSSVDGITAKTTKAVVSNFIPVVGKILSDSVETVVGCNNILKNAVGVIGVIIIVMICIEPIISLGLLTISYHLTAAICQPIADKKIVELISQIGDTFKILLAILCSVSVMLIIGVTLVIKITNSGLMYR